MTHSVRIPPKPGGMTLKQIKAVREPFLIMTPKQVELLGGEGAWIDLVKYLAMTSDQHTHGIVEEISSCGYHAWWREENDENAEWVYE